MNRYCLIPLAAGLALLLAAAPAGAAVKRLKPLDFIPESSSFNVMRTPVAIGSLNGDAKFAAKLPLPVGAVLTKIRMYSNGVAASRQVQVMSWKVGDSSPIGTVTTSLAEPSLVTPRVDVSAPLSAGILGSALYYVEVLCSQGTAVWAVDFEYTP